MCRFAFRPHVWRAACIAIGLMTIASISAAQTAPDLPVQVQTLAEARIDAERAHLWRVAVWGGANLAGGLALAWSMRRDAEPAWWSFGAMSAGWGAVNIGIAAAGLLNDPTLPSTAADALSAERTFHDILLVNLGLNVAYAGVGTTMLIAGNRDVRAAGEWRGFGTSLILQGAGLLALDGIAFVASRARLGDLLGVTGHLSALTVPPGVALTVTF